MFSEDAAEQELYHATATVTSLLLEMGEVGKLFSSSSSSFIRKDLLGETKSELNTSTRDASEPKDSREAGVDDAFQRRNQEENKPKTCEEEAESEQMALMHDIKLEDSSPKDTATSMAMLISDDETKDDTSMSSYSVLSACSHELDEKLQCEDIAEDTVLVHSDPGADGDKGSRPSGSAGHLDKGLPHSTSIDKDWAITFEQFLASVLTEQALVHYFEKPVEVAARITNAKNVHEVGRPLLSSSDYEISLSG